MGYCYKRWIEIDGQGVINSNFRSLMAKIRLTRVSLYWGWLIANIGSTEI